MATQSIIPTTTTTTTTTSAIPTTPAQATARGVTRLEVGGILLMMAGWGYINGNFFQPLSASWGPFIDIVHAVPLVALGLVALGLLRFGDEANATLTRRRGQRIGVTILSVYAVIGCLVMIALGTFAPSIGVGVQAFSDWLAVILTGGGAVLWLASLFAGRRA